MLTFSLYLDTEIFMKYQRFHNPISPLDYFPHRLSQTTKSLDAKAINLLAKIQRKNLLISNAFIGTREQDILRSSSKLKEPFFIDQHNDIQLQEMLLKTPLSLILRDKELKSHNEQIMNDWSQEQSFSESEKSGAHKRSARERSALEGISSLKANADCHEALTINSLRSNFLCSLQYLTALESCHSENLYYKLAVNDQDGKENCSTTKSKKKYCGNATFFPIKLHRLLLDLAHVHGGTDIACFLPNGKAFIIQDPHRFEIQVMKCYFPRMNSLASFHRQLNLYDFCRINHGPFRGAYYHPQFIRDFPLLSTTMKPINKQRKMQFKNI
jgi:hypothetical protein